MKTAMLCLIVIRKLASGVSCLLQADRWLCTLQRLILHVIELEIVFVDALSCATLHICILLRLDAALAVVVLLHAVGVTLAMHIRSDVGGQGIDLEKRVTTIWQLQVTKVSLATPPRRGVVIFALRLESHSRRRVMPLGFVSL